MSKSCREHRPLLCDEYSDEELDIASPKFQRRPRYSSSGRAKTQAKGAAAILTRWPEHLSSVLTYWWMGLGMIAVLIFVIYNSIVAIAILPPTHTRPAKIQGLDHNLLNGSQENALLPNIYMHIFVTSNHDLNINHHLRYIGPFSKKYSAFQKNFVIIVNDLTDDFNSISDEMRNEIALNSLLSDSKDVEKKTFANNITFKIISLTKYMDASPIKKYWRSLPKQFIEFLTRCIAIWDKGGIAFSPEILTSNSLSPVYIDKIHTFLNKYVQLNKTTEPYKKKNTRKNRKKVNNIRDIIDNLESDERYNNVIQYNLSEAENREVISNASYDIKKLRDTKFELLKNNNESKLNRSDFMFISKQHNNMTVDNSNQKLPMLINIMNDKQSILTKFDNKSNVKLKRNQKYNRNSNSFIPATHEVRENSQSASDHRIDNSRLMIDLKGHLVATDTPCHAFIGTVFSNALHHSED